MTFSLRFVLLPLLIALAGCGKKVEELPSTDSLEGGLWRTGCESSSSAYQKAVLNVENGSYSIKTTVYSDGACSQTLYEQNQSGSYTLSSYDSSTGRGNIDLTLGSITLVPSSVSVANSLNSSSFCGLTNWASGLAQTVAGRNCGGVLVPSVGQVTYDIYQISRFGIPMLDVEIGDLNFGYNDATYDGSTPAKRPVATTTPTFRR